MTGSNLFTLMPAQSPNHYSCLVDDLGFVLLGKFDTIGSPNTTPNVFQVGCLMFKTDNGGGSAIFQNVGTLASPVWEVLDAGASGIGSLTGDVIAAGSGSVQATVEGWWGEKLNQTAFQHTGSLFTNAIPQWSGNPAVGWITAEHLDATASSGVATMPGANNGTNCIVTTESLTTAAGATVTLEIISGQFTSATNFLPFVRYGTCTTGTPQIISWTQSGGSVTFTIKNTDPTNPFNGTLIVGMMGF